MKVYEHSFISQVPSIAFHCSRNMQLILLIGHKRGINVIQPGGAVHMAAKVIDLLQDLGLSPPLCRVIFLLQMENKLPFLAYEKRGNCPESRGAITTEQGLAVALARRHPWKYRFVV